MCLQKLFLFYIIYRLSFSNYPTYLCMKYIHVVICMKYTRIEICMKYAVHMFKQ